MSSPVPSTSAVSTLEFNPLWMQVAFREARLALSEGEVPIGAVFVKEEFNGVTEVKEKGHVLIKGRNEVNKSRNATKHAELVCLLSLQKSDPNLDFSSIIVYVNCEPCLMCAGALKQVGVKAIYFGCSNPRFGGCGTVLDVFSLPGKTQTLVSGGHCSEEAVEILKEFYKQENPSAPEDKRKVGRV